MTRAKEAHRVGGLCYLRREFYSIIYKVRKDVWRAGITAVYLYQTNRERDRRPSGDHEKLRPQAKKFFEKHIQNG